MKNLSIEKNISLNLGFPFRGHSDNMWHFFWPVLDPLPHVSFGDTGTDSAPLTRCDVTFSIFQK